MKTIFIIIILAFTILSCQEPNFNVENLKWEACGDYVILGTLLFDKDHLYARNDSIFSHKNDSLIGIIDKKEWNERSDYMYNWLYVKEPLSGKIARYCEQ